MNFIKQALGAALGRECRCRPPRLGSVAAHVRLPSTIKP
jgi:hypothetical protein